MSHLRISRLTKTYEGNEILKGVSLEVSEGEFVTILGPSGCGKTTTLRCIAGLETIDGGDIWLGDRLLSRGGVRRPLPPERRGIGMVFQNYAIWPHMTVKQNVAFPLKMHRVRGPKLASRVDEVLEMVGLSALSDMRTQALSGGQQQRVGLARALVMRPNLLLFDEPLSNLDARLRLQLGEEIHRIQSHTSTTAVYVTHDIAEAASLSDRICVMRAGLVAQVATPDELFSRPADRSVAELVGFDNFFTGRALGSDPNEVAVKLDDGGVVVHGRGSALAGARVSVAFRSTAAAVRSLAEDAEEQEEVFHGHLVELRRGGGTELFRISSAGQGELRVRLQGRAVLGDRGPRPGDPVRVTVARSDVIVLYLASEDSGSRQADAGGDKVEGGEGRAGPERIGPEVAVVK